MSISLEVDRKSVRDFQKRMNRFATVLKKDATDALKVGTIYFCKAMAARTRVAPKKRKIVKNPNPRAGIDGRVAPYGVMKYNRAGKLFFSPIGRGGEYGAKVKYITRNKLAVQTSYGKWDVMGRDEARIHLDNNPGTYRQDAKAAASLNEHKKREIMLSGLAKNTWGIILQELFGTTWVMGRGRGKSKFMKIATENIFTQKGGGANAAFVRFINKLRYSTQALKGAPSAAASEAMVAASNQIRKAVERSLAKGGARK